MSRIFEALQRAIGEATGEMPTGPRPATSLLQQSERAAAPAWKRAARDISAMRGAPEIASAEKPRHEGGDLPLEAPSSRFRSTPIPAPGARLAFLTDPESAGAEAFRLAAVRLRELRREMQLKRVLITSTTTQEGKSVVSANLACALGRGLRVLLLEGDIRRPTLCSLFGLETQKGLCDWLGGNSTLEEAICHLEEAGICLLPAGIAPPASMDALRSPVIPELMQTLSEWFDIVLVDSPPVLPLADTSVWGQLADGILLVTRQGITEKRKLQKGLQAIESRKLLGAIVNSCTSFEEGAYSYYHRMPQATPADSNAAD